MASKTVTTRGGFCLRDGTTSREAKIFHVESAFDGRPFATMFDAKSGS